MSSSCLDLLIDPGKLLQACYATRLRPMPHLKAKVEEILDWGLALQGYDAEALCLDVPGEDWLHASFSPLSTLIL
jgi:hypothetical protein